MINFEQMQKWIKRQKFDPCFPPEEAVKLYIENNLQGNKKKKALQDLYSVAGHFQEWEYKQQNKEIKSLEEDLNYQRGYREGYFTEWSNSLSEPKDNSLYEQGFASGRNAMILEKR